LIGTGVAADHAIAIPTDAMGVTETVQTMLDPGRVITFVIHEQQA
jgi:hypothetical protein